MPKDKIALFGGGAACLFAAYMLGDKYDIDLYEKGKTVGRKFLVAGNGGFNLTNHAQGINLQRVYSDQQQLHNALALFDTQKTREWLRMLGIETFVGSSGRVFPEKGIKPIEVLQKITAGLESKGVQIHLKSSFVGFDADKTPQIQSTTGVNSVKADYYVFGLGGGSWSITGANDLWLKPFEDIGITTVPFSASNCGLNVDWSTDFITRFAGTPIKNVSVRVGNIFAKGEVLITDYGLEGNAIYPIIPEVRDKLKSNEEAILHIDVKPNNTLDQLLKKAKGIRAKNYAFAFNLDKATLQFVKGSLDKETYLNPLKFAACLKNVPVKAIDLRKVEEAISTVGGIDMDEIGQGFELQKFPNMFVIGEMLDWDAPTGGFLLQGCFSTAFMAANHLLKK